MTTNHWFLFSSKLKPKRPRPLGNSCCLHYHNIPKYLEGLILNHFPPWSTAADSHHHLPSSCFLSQYLQCLKSHFHPSYSTGGRKEKVFKMKCNFSHCFCKTQVCWSLDTLQGKTVHKDFYLDHKICKPF